MSELALKNELSDVYHKVSRYISHAEYPENFKEPDAQDTWSEFCKTIKEIHSKYKHHIHESYLHGIKCLEYSESSIPTLSHLSDCLIDWGWRAVWVNGYVPSSVYAALISRGCFPIAQIMRRKGFIEHSPIPDFIHDVWGHLPLLCDKVYSKYIREIAVAIENAETNEFDDSLYEAQLKVAQLKHQMFLPNNPELIQAEDSLSQLLSMTEKFPSKQALLSRVFLWSIEFGILQEKFQEKFKIVGAGILSAPTELTNIIDKKIKLTTYTAEVVNTGLLQFSDVQPELFIINSFQDWRDVLSEITASF